MQNLNHKVVKLVRPTAEENIDFYCVDTNGKITLVWNSTTIDRPTEEELQAAVLTHLAHEQSIAYINKRKTEYPPIEEYLDAVVKNDLVAIDLYKEKCLAVKAKYPKGV